MTRISSALMIDRFEKKNGVNSDSLTHPPSNCYDLTWRKKVLLTKNSRLLWRQVVAKYLCFFLLMWSAVSILTQKWFSKVTFSPYIFFLVFTGFAPGLMVSKHWRDSLQTSVIGPRTHKSESYLLITLGQLMKYLTICLRDFTSQFYDL